MFFDTPVYLCFLTLVVLLYWRFDRRGQNILLLIASYFFYGWWDWRFLILILISTVVDFFAARYIANSSDVVRRRSLLTLSLALNFGFLGFFKYFNFFADSLNASLARLGFLGFTPKVLRILLPPGISFYTFQAVAYIVDVYRGKLKPAESLLDYGLFISFFPHLVAGPIQRPSHLLPQVQQRRRLDGDRFFDGLMLILTGLFRKCVVANSCAMLADAAFSGRMGPPDAGIVLVGTYAFAWQIYADFSGYSDIARGSAQLMGFHFMVNFWQPYLAVSLQDFWRRWHISLSTWLRDYVYIPLGGNRHGEVKKYRNLLATMLLGGLWHGANWTFVIWGAIQGLGLSIERMLGLERSEQRPRLSWVVTWTRRIVIFHCVCLAWVFFRAQSFSEAVAFLQGLGRLHFGTQFASALTFLASYTIPLFALDLALESREEEYLFQRSSVFFRPLAAGLALLMIVMAFTANKGAAFIYFQF
jgi:D-alanyl-lipoteichoic acid acyltransferase DltB (MBOAT superfamily)